MANKNRQTIFIDDQDDPRIVMYTEWGYKPIETDKKQKMTDLCFVQLPTLRNEPIFLKGNQGFKILLCLAQRPGQKVTKDDIIKNCQPMEESSFKSEVSRLITALNSVCPGLVESDTKTNNAGHSILCYRFNDHFLRGDDQTSEAKRTDQIRSQLAQILFPSAINSFLSPLALSEGFYKRAKLINRIKELKTNSSAVFITGSPYSGKTTFLEHFCAPSEKEEILASFFCKYDDAKRRDPIHMIKEISLQLVNQSDFFCRKLWGVVNRLPKEELITLFDLDEPQKAVENAFHLLIEEPLRITLDNDPLSGFIVIDALDECDFIEFFLKQLNNILPLLQGHITFLMSCRTSLSLRMIRQNLRTSIDMADYTEEIMEYIKKHLPKVNDENLKKLTTICGSNFLCAKMICDSILTNATSIDDIESINMDEVFFTLFDQIFDGRYPKDVRKALSVIIALKSPVCTDILGLVLGLNAGEIRHLINGMMELLDSKVYETQDCVVLFHKSVNDWLQKKEAQQYRITEQEGDVIIFDYLYRNLRTEDSDYAYSALKNIPYSVFGDWEYYGKKSGHPEYEKMHNDIRLQLDTLRLHRIHGEFEKALRLAHRYLPNADREPLMFLPMDRLDIGSSDWFAFSQRYCDILVDINDWGKAETHLNKMGEYLDSLSSNELIQVVTYYRSRAWLLMEKAENEENEVKRKMFNEAQDYFDMVYDRFKQSPNSYNDDQRAHTLYLNAILHFRQQQVVPKAEQSSHLAESKKMIEKAIQLLSDIDVPTLLENAKEASKLREIIPKTVDFSIMLKHAARTIQEIAQEEASNLQEQGQKSAVNSLLVKQYQEAEQLFDLAKTVQMDVFYDQPKIIVNEAPVPVTQYMAHTFMSLADNEWQLYDLTRDANYAGIGLQHIDCAIFIYKEFPKDWFKAQLERCERIREKLPAQSYTSDSSRLSPKQNSLLI